MTTGFSNDALNLSTPRLCLRPVAAADAQSLFEIHADPQAMRYWSTPPWIDPAQAARVIESDRSEREAGRSIRLAVLDAPTDVLIGCCSLFNIDRVQGRGEMGYILRRSCWGRGFMTEALSAVVSLAFAQFELRRLEVDLDPRNEASATLVRRLGFRQEALMRERWLVGGEVSDAAIYGLLRSDWLQARS